ncbi:hypothetical protein EIN_504350 [Entamoeba invadens IP1]|uniref:Uncharacterized protein n=1 Tax=Entamoeba invadens IP1 TaxID=370355 RepID=A0A0A1U7H5_ENTIV|nr:hypothetical protein EIN_504350 [Entamoeba invadens IP1]ELP90289.1 hypothetical protein EIN_504350 [Entamoeba invadens IP1]|eukprot:XP_004257060.1 hypothetical protein EIN_504350 [Entamoeba invadens IP1]
MTIQSSHFHKLVRYAISNNLLPWSFCTVFGSKQKELDFYSYGVVKHLLSEKIVHSFSVCDPKFFTSFRDGCMAAREQLFDELLSSYIPVTQSKGKRVCMVIAECSLVSPTLNFHDGQVVLGIQSFLINNLFVAGCQNFFHYDFSIAGPDRNTLRVTDYSRTDVNLSGLFN